MNQPDERIIKFIKKHHVLTLATSINNQAYCCNCFYSFLDKENKLIFTSDLTTKHVQEFLQNQYVAASIVLETRIIGKIQGLQINGYIHEPVDEDLAKANTNYLKKFPFARLMETKLWEFEITFLKFTDNLLGFGKKIIWKKE